MTAIQSSRPDPTSNPDPSYLVDAPATSTTNLKPNTHSRPASIRMDLTSSVAAWTPALHNRDLCSTMELATAKLCGELKHS